MKVISTKAEFLQFTLELLCINAKIDQRANKHVAADAAENVQVKSAHVSETAARLLIWLAA